MDEGLADVVEAARRARVTAAVRRGGRQGYRWRMPRMQHVESSSVDAVGFDPARNELTVRFVSGDTYVYGMVPRAMFEALLTADSIGRFVNERIKPRHPVRGS
ncbi:hypothetical protein ACVWW9_002337 [Agrococcus sp. UYP33]